ncbi:hypothetical protein KQX54_012961 [Cotesia glomerata]|uniref:Uncharacterized protein n=1 Tax=Cotesia glomerata TaxID=32391 RepID=A0AAV7HV71_COTGL|nr:hypothetical protein KQX54_012961 [Cotesia glomerata]
MQMSILVACSRFEPAFLTLIRQKFQESARTTVENLEYTDFREFEKLIRMIFGYHRSVNQYKADLENITMHGNEDMISYVNRVRALYREILYAEEFEKDGITDREKSKIEKDSPVGNYDGDRQEFFAKKVKPFKKKRIFRTARKRTVFKSNKIEHDNVPLLKYLDENSCNSNPLNDFNCLNGKLSSHAIVGKELGVLVCSCICMSEAHAVWPTHEKLGADISNNQVDELFILATTESNVIMPIRPRLVASEIEHTLKNDRVEFVISETIKTENLLYLSEDNRSENNYFQSLDSKFYSPLRIASEEDHQKNNRHKKLINTYNIIENISGYITSTCSTIIKYIYFIILVMKYIFDKTITLKKGLRFWLNILKFRKWKIKFVRSMSAVGETQV